jgi:hypothetical protein
LSFAPPAQVGRCPVGKADKVGGKIKDAVDSMKDKITGKD